MFRKFACALGILLVWPASAKAQVCDPPRALIVVDWSSSMTYDVAGRPKWQAARDAVENMTTNFGDEVDFGLMRFPYPNHCSPGQVLVDIGPNTGDAIRTALNDPPPSGGNYTPLAQSLDEAASYQPLLEEPIPRYVILITDGWQWCDPYDASTRFLAVDSVQHLKNLGVTTYVVGFGGGEDALLLNRLAVTAGTAFPGCDESSTDPSNPNNCYYHADDYSALSAALQDIASQLVIQPEVCDNRDNDCDGLTDEDLTRPCETACGTGQETCANGFWMGCTAPQPTEEVCDGQDNDCDGVTDEGCECIDGQTRPCGSDVGACVAGTQVCENGQWSTCQGEVAPQPETCNNLDDDCDGLTDEGLYRQCQTACGVGQEICIGGNWTGCTAPEPSPELCDNLDNDCDGLTDEDLTRSCDNACGTGFEHCEQGSWVGCTAPQPEPEACDNRDNDCDGTVDEGCSCITGAQRPCGFHIGACSPGVQVCEDGTWSDCQGGTSPTPEACDNLDNDCDGATDEDLARACTTACGAGREICVNGQWQGCTAPLPSGEVCDGKDNDCDGQVDEGAGLCGVNEVCVDGRCVPAQDDTPDATGPGASADTPDACGCHTGRSGLPIGLVLLVALGLALRRRR